jgi:hypothetical protein
MNEQIKDVIAKVFWSLKMLLLICLLAAAGTGVMWLCSMIILGRIL